MVTLLMSDSAGTMLHTTLGRRDQDVLTRHQVQQRTGRQCNQVNPYRNPIAPQHRAGERSQAILASHKIALRIYALWEACSLAPHYLCVTIYRPFTRTRCPGSEGLTCGGAPSGPVTCTAFVRPSSPSSTSNSTGSFSRRLLNPSASILLCDRSWDVSQRDVLHAVQALSLRASPHWQKPQPH